MRNRPFVLPAPKSDATTNSPDPGNLKNKFSGKIIFRNSLYHLETGNFSVLEKTDNNWFLEELFKYALANNDFNLIPVLRRVAENARYTESIRQHASETLEIIEERTANYKKTADIRIGKAGEDKAAEARKMLAGVRFPQTTEILRLLREKSPELKRLALFLIGKFNMTDMIQEVCQCLSTPGIETDAYSVLLSFGGSAGNDLNRFFLISSGNMYLSKVILRIYAESCPQNDLSFLVERLLSNQRQLKEISLNALISCGYQARGDDRERLDKVIYETFGILARIVSDKVCLLEKDNTLLYSEMEKEYLRWKDFLLKLLILNFGNTVSAAAIKSHSGEEENNFMSIPMLADIIFGNHAGSGPEIISDPGAEKKMFKKLMRFFPGEVPNYKDLLEDIVNSDYNILSIWTKACAIRNISEIEDDEIGETVVALLFSPEELLRQEAARLIARYDKELYRAASERIPEPVKESLEMIISGKTDDNELLFEKVKFLTSCFKGIHEDDLLFLSQEVKYAGKNKADPGIEASGALVWTLGEEGTLNEVYVIREGEDTVRKIKEKLSAGLSCYILPLIVVEEYSSRYQESSYPVLKYIDDNEE